MFFSICGFLCGCLCSCTCNIICGCLCGCYSGCLCGCICGCLCHFFVVVFVVAFVIVFVAVLLLSLRPFFAVVFVAVKQTQCSRGCSINRLINCQSPDFPWLPSPSKEIWMALYLGGCRCHRGMLFVVCMRRLGTRTNMSATEVE